MRTAVVNKLLFTRPLINLSFKDPCKRPARGAATMRHRQEQVGSMDAAAMRQLPCGAWQLQAKYQGLGNMDGALPDRPAGQYVCKDKSL